MEGVDIFFHSTVPLFVVCICMYLKVQIDRKTACLSRRLESFLYFVSYYCMRFSLGNTSNVNIPLPSTVSVKECDSKGPHLFLPNTSRHAYVIQKPCLLYLDLSVF